MSILLCGLPASGKTVVGRRLAEELHWGFLDTDELIEQAYAMEYGKAYSCRQIFLAEGELAFRRLERRQVASLQGISQRVVALGGGCLDHPENRAALQALGQIVCLKAHLHVLWMRILQRGIPPYLDADDPERAFYVMAQRRELLFGEVAQFIIDTQGLYEEAVVDAVLNGGKWQHGK